MTLEVSQPLPNDMFDRLLHPENMPPMSMTLEVYQFRVRLAREEQPLNIPLRVVTLATFQLPKPRLETLVRAEQPSNMLLMSVTFLVFNVPL